MTSFFHATFSAFSALTHGAIVLAAVVLSVYSVYSRNEPCPISCYINPISIRSTAHRLWVDLLLLVCLTACETVSWSWQLALLALWALSSHSLGVKLLLLVNHAALSPLFWSVATSVGYSYSVNHAALFFSSLYFEVACETVSWSLGVNVTSSRLFFLYIFSLYVVNPKKMAIFLEFPNNIKMVIYRLFTSFEQSPLIFHKKIYLVKSARKEKYEYTHSIHSIHTIALRVLLSSEIFREVALRSPCTSLTHLDWYQVQAHIRPNIIPYATTIISKNADFLNFESGKHIVFDNLKILTVKWMKNIYMV